MMHKICRPFVMKDLEKTGIFSGYASVYHICDAQNETILPGAFSESLQKNPRPKLLWQHDPQEPIGIWQELIEDSHGLFVKGQIFLELQRGKEAHLLLKQGIVDGLSIGYIPLKVEETPFGRNLESIDLQEISLVTFPSNPQARIHHVKMSTLPPLLEDIEDLESDIKNFIEDLRAWSD